jgi:hypothetical protein
VGTHGRESALCSLLILLTSGAAVSAQTSFPYQDLAADLAARIASAIPAGAQVSLAPVPENQTDDMAAFSADQASRLMNRGIRVGEAAEGVTAIRLGCRQNLRERSCVAEIQSGAARDLVMVTRPHDGRARREAVPWFSLDVRPLFTQRVQLLDVAIAGDRLLVLDVQSLSLYQRTAGAWQPLESRPLGAGRTWPRDPRGRLRITGDRFEAWLPGVTCTGVVAPLAVACADGQRPWPIGIDNGGLDAGRNHFTTPEGFAFYSAAQVAFYSAAPVADPAGPRWLVADRDGALTWLDAERRAAGNAGFADEVAGLASACGGDATVVAVERAPGGDGHALRTFEAVRGRLVPAAAPIALAGHVTALWSTPGSDAATLIVHDAGAARYETLQIRIACGR